MPRNVTVITGRITSRRVLGKHLAFVTLQPEPHAPADGDASTDSSTSAAVEAAPLQKVCFRRGDEWDEEAASADGALWLPFPQRKSMLPPSRLVCVEIAAPPPPPTAAVSSGGQSQPPPNGGAQLVVARWRFADGSGHHGGGSKLGGPATAGGAYEMSEVARRKAQAHAAATATEHATLKRQQSEPTLLQPLCKRWMFAGCCAEWAQGGCADFRHKFVSDDELGRAKRLRAAREASVAHSKLEQQQYDATVAPTKPTAGGETTVVDGLFTEGSEGSACLVVTKGRAGTGASGDGQHSGGKQQKRRRAKEFVRWLLRTYGKTYLQSGTGVHTPFVVQAPSSQAIQCYCHCHCTDGVTNW